MIKIMIIMATGFMRFRDRNISRVLILPHNCDKFFVYRLKLYKKILKNVKK